MSDARVMAFSLLTKIYRDNAYSNIMLSDKSIDSLSPKDASLCHLLVKGVLERQISLDYNISLYLNSPIKKLKPQVHILLRLGAYQIFFADSIPDRAAINETVNLAKQTGNSFATGLINAVLRKCSTNGFMLPNDKDTYKYLSVKYSYPEYICKLYADYYGMEPAEGIMRHTLEKTLIYARRNTLKNSKIKANYKESQILPDAIELDGSFKNSDDIDNGLFHVCDLSSQLACIATGAKPGESVIDVCAAPGGKSIMIAELMNNNGSIISCDIHEHRLKLIENNAKRLGVSIISTVLRDAAVGSPDDGLYDLVVCDVPCSGLGVVSKKPEIKYKSFDDMNDLYELQYQILTKSASLVKPGGRLLYSTCTLNPKENIENVKRFKMNNQLFYSEKIFEDLPLFRDDDTATILPQTFSSDGFFIALFRRKMQ